MGVDFVGRSSWGADFFEEAKAISGLDIFDLCTNGPAEELDQVNNQLPCLVAASLASARALGERGLQPDCVAGFGIGEYAAHAIAGTADLECLLTLASRVGALAAMADRVIRINSGRVLDETVNPNPTPVERIEW